MKSGENALPQPKKGKPKFVVVSTATAGSRLVRAMLILPIHQSGFFKFDSINVCTCYTLVLRGI
jgi:hypothetical protein